MNKSIIPVIILLLLTGIVNAAFLDKTESCSSSWYCTAYSQEECGTRSCVDINLCDTNKMTEFESCQKTTDTTTLPQGYFSLNKDAVKLTIEQEKVMQQIILVNSSASEEYTLNINYPSSYTKGTDFITTSNNKKAIDQKGDFNIIIDTRNILVGTYVIPINISNKAISKTVLLIIDVVPKNNPKITLDTNSKIITLEKDKEIAVNLKAKGIDIVSGNKLTYELIDPSGNVILEDEKTFSAIENQESISLPKDITEGRYTLSAKIVGSTTYVKSITFTTVTPNKYYRVASPKNYRTLTIIIVIIIIIAGITMFLIKRNTPYKPYSKRKNYKYYSGVGILRSSFGKPDFGTIKTGLEFGFLSKLKKALRGATKIAEERELNDSKRAELLKRSFDRGFISLKEYHDALKSQRTLVEKEVVEEHHKEIQIDKKEEISAKQTKQEKELEKELTKLKEEREKQQKEKEKQQKEMEKAEAEVLKQEEKIRKELEEQKELREKQQKEEKEREIRRNKEIERIRSEIEAEQKEIEKLKKEEKSSKSEKLTTPIAPEIKFDTKEKTPVSPMGHLIVKDVVKEEAKEEIKENIEGKRTKDNILDKRVGDQQSFGMSNGERLYCLRDLLEALPHIQEHVFDHHTKQGRNDFANWIGDVFKYYDIAEQVRNSDTKEEIIKILKKYE